MVRGLLLDSGDTLMRPTGDRWNPRFDFESILVSHYPDLASADFTAAFAAGDRFLAEWPLSTAASEYTRLRADYHRSILAVLGIHDPSDAILEEFDSPRPFSELVEPFADVAEVLPQLRACVDGMAIVADTGSHMVDVYRDHGLHGFFDVFVISQELGCGKPDPLMYRAASEALGLEPADCLFVDDKPENVEGALDLGYQACGISRYREPPGDDGLTWIRTLADLQRLIAAL